MMRTGRFDDMFLTTHNLWEKEDRQFDREQIMQAIYKKEEKAMKFDKCITCVHRDSHWRCGACHRGEMYAAVEHQITTEYHTIGRRNGKNMAVKEYLNMLYGTKALPRIKDVIFNDPATIVFWEDGTKTVVKVMEGDEFDPHTGLAQAISKKALGDDYRKEFKKWTKPYYKKKAEVENMEKENANLLAQFAEDAINAINKINRKRGVTD